MVVAGCSLPIVVCCLMFVDRCLFLVVVWFAQSVACCIIFVVCVLRRFVRWLWVVVGCVLLGVVC